MLPTPAQHRILFLLSVSLIAGCATTNHISPQSTVCIEPEKLEGGHCVSSPPTPPAAYPPAVPHPIPPKELIPVPASAKVTFAANIHFESGDTNLDPESRAILDELVSKLASINLEVIIAVGHAEARGTNAYANVLAKKRAEVTKGYMTSLGVEFGRIYTESKGSLQPIATNKTAQGRRMNNRVEIEIVGTSENTKPSTLSWQVNPLVPVLFATNRKRTGSDTGFYFYGNEQTDELRRGVALVKVPPKRQRGEITRPPWIATVLERASSQPLVGAGVAGSIGGFDSTTQFTFARKIEELTEQEFKKDLLDAVKHSKSRTAVLYVHGYANDFADGAFRAAQFAYDLSTEHYDIVPILFSWASDPGFLGMNYAEARRRSEIAGYDLARFLDEIADKTDIARINIVAHSMGAEVLAHALMKMAADGNLQRTVGNQSKMPRFRQIVFAAPDITPRIFENLIEPAIKSQYKITSYGSSKDLALWLSQFKNNAIRQGANSGQIIPLKDIDTIDISAAAEPGLAHSTWAQSARVLDDLRQVLCTRTPPADRGLSRRREMGTVIWSLPRSGGISLKDKTKVKQCPPDIGIQ